MWEASKELPVEELPVESFKELDWAVWEHALTPREFLQHYKRVQQADMSYPIILTPNGSVADGMHRLVKALLEGRLTIQAVRLRKMPKRKW